MKAKKSLGQHFLTSQEVARQIRDAADPTGDEIILEIGPGTGALTDELLPFAGKLVAVEKDSELVEKLKEKYRKQIEEGKIELIEGDILEFDPATLSFYERQNYKVIANIPYYITGAIVRKFLTTGHQPERMVLMVQEEVAERIVAADGKESILSISVKAYGDASIVCRVPAELFSPPPKVDSAVVAIEHISRDFFTKSAIDENLFFDLVRRGFAHKRKMLAGNLAGLTESLTKERILSTLEEMGLKNARAQDLSLADWDNLYQTIFKS